MLCDVASKMLDRAREQLSRYKHVQFSLLDTDDALLRLVAPNSLDFVVCFDVLVHCDVHTIFTYLKQLRRLLKPTGRLFLSTSDLSTEAGFARFEQQSAASVAGFVWTSRDAVRQLIKKAGFVILDESQPSDDPSNLFIRRDFLVLLQPSSN